MDPQTMAIDDWELLSAALNGRSLDERDDALAERGIEPAEWEAANLRFLTQLADEIARGDFEHADAYGRRCVDELARRGGPTDERTVTAVPGSAPTLPFAPGSADEVLARIASAPHSERPALRGDPDATQAPRPNDDPTLPFLRTLTERSTP